MMIKRDIYLIFKITGRVWNYNLKNVENKHNYYAKKEPDMINYSEIIILQSNKNNYLKRRWVIIINSKVNKVKVTIGLLKTVFKEKLISLHKISSI